MDSPAAAILSARYERPRTLGLGLLAQAPQDPAHPLIVLAVKIVGVIAPNSGLAYARVFRDYFLFAHERGVDPGVDMEENVLKWLESLRHQAQTTIAQHGAIMKRLLRDAVLTGIVTASDTVKIKYQKGEAQLPNQALTDLQVGEFFAAITKDLANPRKSLTARRDLAASHLMVRIGPRRDAVVNTAFGDLTPWGRPEWISLLLKGGKRVTRALPDDVTSALAAWWSAVEAELGRPVRPDEPVFPRTSGSAFRFVEGSLVPMSGRALSDRVRRRTVKLGFRRARVRRTCSASHCGDTCVRGRP